MGNCHERGGIQFDPTSCGDGGNYTVLLYFSPSYWPFQINCFHSKMSCTYQVEEKQEPSFSLKEKQ